MRAGFPVCGIECATSKHRNRGEVLGQKAKCAVQSLRHGQRRAGQLPLRRAIARSRGAPRLPMHERVCPVRAGCLPIVQGEGHARREMQRWASTLAESIDQVLMLPRLGLRLEPGASAQHDSARARTESVALLMVCLKIWLTPPSDTDNPTTPPTCPSAPPPCSAIARGRPSRAPPSPSPARSQRPPPSPRPFPRAQSFLASPPAL